MERITRRERRALRQQRFVTAREASLAARLAHLYYKVPGEAGALRVPTHSLIWHQGDRPNGQAPPTGRERRVRTCRCGEDPGHLRKAPEHSGWRRLMAEY